MPDVSVPEQGGGKLIPEGICNPGQVYTVSRGKSGMIGVFRLESQMLPATANLSAPASAQTVMLARAATQRSIS